MNMIKVLIAILALAAYTPANAIGPVKAPNFLTLVANAVPPDDGNVRIAGKAEMLPDTKGYSRIRSYTFHNPFLRGVLVITDKAILFQQWDKKTGTYDIVKRIPISDIRTVTQDSYRNKGNRLVIQKSDYSYDSFDFVNSVMIDAEMNEQAFILLNTLINNSK
jgi:hypothetical protein